MRHAIVSIAFDGGASEQTFADGFRVSVKMQSFLSHSASTLHKCMLPKGPTEPSQNLGVLYLINQSGVWIRGKRNGNDSQSSQLRCRECLMPEEQHSASEFVAAERPKRRTGSNTQEFGERRPSFIRAAGGGGVTNAIERNPVKFICAVLVCSSCYKHLPIAIPKRRPTRSVTYLCRL